MEQLQKYMTVISKILETCLDESWTHQSFQILDFYNWGLIYSKACLKG